MKRCIPLLVVIFAATCSFGQATKTASGNWSDPAKWVSGNIGDNISENVVINTKASTTILSGQNYTIGNLLMHNDNTLTINDGGVLNVGSGNNKKNFTLLVDDENNAAASVLNVHGTLIISGDLILEALSDVDINVSATGTLIVHGSVQYSDNVYTNFNVSGGKVIIHNNIKQYTAEWVYADFTFSVITGIMAINGNVEITGGASLTTCEEYGTENCVVRPPFEEPFCDCKSKPGVFLVSGGCDGGFSRYFCEYSEITPWVANDIGVERIISPGNEDVTLFTPAIEIRNYGTNTVESAQIQLVQNGAPVETKNFSINLGLFETATVNFSSQAVPSGDYIFGFNTVLTNGVPDGNPSNSSPTVLSKINKSNQTITFAPLGPKQVGSGPFSLNASASSGLAVTYTSSNTSVATISGNQVTIVSPGTTTITASQEGNDIYNAAPAVSRELIVSTVTSVDNPIPTVTEVYPNPVRGELTIVVSGVIKDPLNEVVFYDMMGRVFPVRMEPTFEPDKYTCNLANFTAGVYLISLSGQKNAKKIIKVQ